MCTTFRFDKLRGVWYKIRNCLSTGLVPRSRSAWLKGKRVQVPRCPATVRGDRRRIVPLGKTWEGAAKERSPSQETCHSDAFGTSVERGAEAG